MNFFTKWGKSKISNRTTEANVEYDSSLAIIGDNANRMYSRTNAKKIQRRKNSYVTRSLFYDSDKNDEELDSKIKKAQSCNNLDSCLEEELVTENKQNIEIDLKPKQELKVKKFFSVENLFWKESNKSKTKHVLTKDMISRPSESSDRNCKASNETSESDNHLPSKLVKIIELEDKSSESVSGDKQVESKIRRSRSIGNLTDIRARRPPRKSSWCYEYLNTKKMYDGDVSFFVLGNPPFDNSLCSEYENSKNAFDTSSSINVNKFNTIEEFKNVPSETEVNAIESKKSCKMNEDSIEIVPDESVVDVILEEHFKEDSDVILRNHNIVQSTQESHNVSTILHFQLYYYCYYYL